MTKYRKDILKVYISGKFNYVHKIQICEQIDQFYFNKLNLPDIYTLRIYTDF